MKGVIMRGSLAVFLSLYLLVSCSQGREQLPEIIKSYDLDSLNIIISKEGVELDEKIRYKGAASIKLSTDRPRTFNLIETGDIDLEDARLVYQAKIRTEDVDGKVYLEMWCVFKDRGEYFSKALNSQLSGTNEWVTQETPFFLRKNENPVNVKLNLVIDGKGTAWIDDIKLFKLSPLN